MLKQTTTVNSRRAALPGALLFALWLALPAFASSQVDTTVGYQLNVGPLEAEIQQASANPARYAVAVDLPAADIVPRGSWQIANGQARWSWQLQADGAQNLSVGIPTEQLSAEAEFWLLGGGIAQGPYRRSESSSPRSKILTAVVPGSRATLLAVMPTAAQQNFVVNGATIFYGFKTLSGYQAAAESDDVSRADEPTTRAGDCLDSNDVVCPIGVAWADQIRASARITINNLLLCSATLLNDTEQSLRPFLLTADHCGENFGTDAAGYDAVDAINTTVYWNFERSMCGGEDDGDLTQNQTGAQLRATNEPIDFALLELSQAPQAAFNVRWSGWDARGVGGRSGASIHHPSGDEKKISLFNESLQKQRPIAELRDQDYWRVRWSDGVTEGGSSGSGLWNQDRRLVGSLSRGLSECRTAENSSNGNPERFPDFYSAFDAAWVGNGQNNGRLSNWLDAANTGTLAVNGRNANAPAEPVGEGSPSDGGSGGGSGDQGAGSTGSSGGGGGGAVLWLLAIVALRRIACNIRFK